MPEQNVIIREGTAVVRDLDWLPAALGEIPADKSCEYFREAYFDARMKETNADPEYTHNGFRSEYDNGPMRSSVSDTYVMYGVWSRDQDTRYREFLAEKVAPKLREFLDYGKKFGQPLKVYMWVPDKFAFLYYGNPKSGMMFPHPELYMEYVPPVLGDRSKLTPADVRKRLLDSEEPAGIEMVAFDGDALVTCNDISERVKSGQERVKALDEMVSSVERTASRSYYMTDKSLDEVRNLMDEADRKAYDELAEMRLEIDRMVRDLDEKKQAMLAQLAEKKASMEISIEQMMTQVYMLEAQIYSIECYAGTVIDFAKIRSGKNAPDDTPLIIYQKFRFLDEEMGKLASLYEIQWDEVKYFEEFLQSRDDALDIFAPDERCVTIIRLSKTGTTIGRAGGAFGEPEYTDCLKTYEYYHGSSVGIIIRNGENVYMGWTDDDKVNLDDNLVFSRDSMLSKPNIEVPETFESEVEHLKFVKESVSEAKKFTDAIINRAFIFNILQGVLDHTDFLPMPEKVNLMASSPYVVFSMADGWLSDTRFGSFTDIVARCKKRVQKGDMILTLQYLAAHQERHRWSNSWSNDRGRGDRNRTHDVHTENNRIYAVNLVEYDEPVPMYRYRFPIGTDKETGETRWQTSFTQVKFDKDGKEYSGLSDSCEVLERFELVERHVYVSLPKEESACWRNTDARANFELEEDEYLNLTFMNSVWLKWVINNRSLGRWHIGGQPVTYAYGIKYLKNALQFITKREEYEEALIDAVDPSVCDDTEWPLKLSEWKLEHDVHNMTEYQAKRFVKAMHVLRNS